MELVSILIPAHLKNDYLVELIESILRQSYVNFEIVIVINGKLISDKPFLDFLKKMDNRVKLYIYTDENINISKILNYGLSVCIADIILRIDSDDLMLEDRILKQVSFLKENGNISFVASGYKVLKKNFGNSVIRKTKTPGLIGFPRLYFKSCIAAPTTAYRKEDVLNIGGYRSNITYAEDWDLSIRAVKSGYKIFLSDEVLTTYRVHDDQMTSNTFSSLSEKGKSFIKITYYCFMKYKDPIFIVSFLFKIMYYFTYFIKSLLFSLIFLKK